MQGNDSLGTFVPVPAVVGDVDGAFLHGYNSGAANSGSLVCERLYVYVLCKLIGMWFK